MLSCLLLFRPVSILSVLSGVKVLWIFEVSLVAFKQRPKDYCISKSVITSTDKAATISSNNLSLTINNWSLLNSAHTEEPHRMHWWAKWSISFRKPKCSNVSQNNVAKRVISQRKWWNVDANSH